MFSNWNIQRISFNFYWNFNFELLFCSKIVLNDGSKLNKHFWWLSNTEIVCKYCCYLSVAWRTFHWFYSVFYFHLHLLPFKIPNSKHNEQRYAVQIIFVYRSKRIYCNEYLNMEAVAIYVIRFFIAKLRLHSQFTFQKR